MNPTVSPATGVTVTGCPSTKKRIPAVTAEAPAKAHITFAMFRRVATALMSLSLQPRRLELPLALPQDLFRLSYFDCMARPAAPAPTLKSAAEPTATQVQVRPIHQPLGDASGCGSLAERSTCPTPPGSGWGPSASGTWATGAWRTMRT